MPAMPTSDAKAAEFARLFNLFDSLASRRARTTTTTNNDRDAPATTAERQNLLPLPDDFSHVLKNLSTIATAGVRKPRLEYTQRPLRNTLTSISGSRHASDVSAASASGESTISDTEGDVDEEFLAQFPLSDEEGYPFTFKHMVHKLYPKDDAVKEMLEKSKNEFKPLAEQLEAKAKGDEENENDEEKGAEENVVRFRVPTSPGAGRRGSVFGGSHECDQSIIGGASRAISPTRSPGSDLQPEVRALKKRCIGRRSSMSGPLNAFGGTGTGAAPAGTIGGDWVYAAAISSAEHPTAATFSSCPPAPPPSPTTKASFEKYGALGGGRPNLPNMLQARGGVKRRVGAGNPAMMFPLQTLTNRTANEERQIVRKRVIAADTMEKNDQESQAKMKHAL